MKKKHLKKFCINENGNALILVVLLILSMMLIAGAVMAVAFSHFEISQAYKRTSNLYYVAQSGAEKMVDNINKILLENMTAFMKEASEEAEAEVLSNYSELKFQKDITEPDHPGYSQYNGRFHLINKLYEEKLKDKAYTKIHEGIEGTDPTILDALHLQYEIKDEQNKAFVEVSLKSVSQGFIVTSIATLKNPAGESLSKIKLEGDIQLSNLMKHEELFLEEYEWKNGRIPNSFRSPILTFGDLVVTNEASVTIGNPTNHDGHVRAKGYIPPTKGKGEPVKTFFPELEEYGGVYVSNGGKLTVYGDVVTLSNLHTIKKYNIDEVTKIHVTGDIFANSIAIEDDDLYEPNKPLGEVVENQFITIDGDVYLDNDIAIDRHVKDSKIHIKGSVFGITNLDTGSVTDPDPNKSSSIYARGENTEIQIDQNAFVHGSSFISFDGGKNYSELYESMGEPYEHVRFLDNYRDGIAKGDKDYLELKKDSILKNKIKLNTAKYFYAPRRISANGYLYKVKNDSIADDSILINSFDSLNELDEIEKLFNKGGINTSDLIRISPLDSSNKEKWAEQRIDVGSKSPTIASIISNAFEYLKGEDETISPFKRNYFISGMEYYDAGADSTKNYRGIQGYMFLRRDAFYKGIHVKSSSDPTESSTTEEMEFDEFIVNNHPQITDKLQPLDSSTDSIQGWTKDNPIYINDSSSEDKVIDVSEFYDGNHPVHTVVIDKGSGRITLKASDSNKDEFHGMIISSGGVVFEGVEKFTGIMITKGRFKDNNNNGKRDNITIAELVNGEYAGILIKSDMKIYYDSDILFKVKCKDRSIKRLILDYLGITNYVTDTSDVSQILRPSIEIEPVQKVDFSSESVIDVINTDIHKGVRFEMKTLRQIDEGME